jgi:G3E family GTPase
LAAEAYADDNHDHEHDGRGHGHSHQSLDPNRHVDHIRSFCLVYDRPLDWGRFVARMQALIAAHGADLLRIKGLLNITGREAPVVVHGVQHLFHPPVLLDGWPDGDRRSRLVFITRSLDKAAVAKFFTSLQG